MNEIMITWWMGLMMASAAVMFAIVGILKLHEWGIYPLHEMTRFVRRPWFERLLLLFCICGIVQYGATKGTGGGSRSTGDDARKDMPEGVSQTQDLSRDGIHEQAGEITNLCFTGFCVLTNGVVIDVAWPTNVFVDGTTLDFFAKYHALTNDWQWVFAQSTLPGETNMTLFADMVVDFGIQTTPAAMFFKVQDRKSCARTMADSDGDGLPDVYELHNGTNPYVSDYANAPKLTVGPQASYATFGAALAASTNYSIIALPSQPESSSEMIVMPSHPVMVTGPANGYAMLHSSASIAAVMMDAGQGRETLFRNLYVVLEAKDGFQAAFLIGGNLPWSGVGASPTFENVRVRALYPNVLHYGWHYYRDDGGFSSLSNCVMNAAGSTSAIGVYAYDGPEVGVSDCVFVNFPTNVGSYATWIRSETNVVAEVASACTNLSWAGYSLDANYSDIVDSDGDGLSDYEEIHVYDTDPWLADSDGDGLSDAEETEAIPPTTPHDPYSFFRRVTVVTTTSDTLSEVTNYVAWGVSGLGWETNGLATCVELPSTNVFRVSSSAGPMYVKAYRDLNRNGQYDADEDILLVKQVPPQDAVSCFSFRFGDVDGDGVADDVERREGSDPYDGQSFWLHATVKCENSDVNGNVRNYLSYSGRPYSDFTPFTGVSRQMTISVFVTNGTCVVNCLRDFNGNGVYDEGVDVLYTRTLTKSDNGKEVVLSIGDVDGDRQPDSSEVAHGTNPRAAGDYCFNLAFVERGIFSTTNQLTAEVLFGTNVLVGPVVMTNRVWSVDLGHLSTTNGKSVVAYFWDDANSNGVRDAWECCTQQNFRWLIHGHENALTNTLTMGAFDRDKDEVLDYWEILHSDVGLSPDDPSDKFLDPDGDGLTNYHEYWAGCDPAVPDGSNTLISVCSRSVDDRIRGIVPSNAVDRFVNFFENGTNHMFIANTNFWLRDVDVSCVSVWNNGSEPGSMAATAITRKHVIMAAHWFNRTYYFCDTNGNCIVRWLNDWHQLSGSDMLIGQLNDDLPASIRMPCVLCANTLELIADSKYLPSVCMNNRKAATVLELDSLNCDVTASDKKTYRQMGKTSGGNVVSPDRASIWASTVVGNSSSPVFLLAGNELIFLFSKHLGHKGSGASAETWGPVLSYKLIEVQNKIDEWEGVNAPAYQIRVIQGEQAGGF